MKEFFKKYNIDENGFYNGSLDLQGTAITSLPDNLTVGGSLDLQGTAITSLPDNLTVGGSLDLRGTAITSLPDNLTVGGSLDLQGTAITSLPDNLTVGGYLDLQGTAITSLPDNLTVGGYLDLQGTAITSLPDNLTVGGSLDLQGTAITNQNHYKKQEIGLLSWKKGKYILADGRFSEVVSKKGGIYKLKDVNKENYYYLVSDGNGKFAHGDTIKEAKEDLVYKISNRDKSEYENIDVNKKFSFAECIEMYRTITGACATGTRNFIESKGVKNKSFSVSEIVVLTKGNYGSEEFSKFFKVK